MKASKMESLLTSSMTGGLVEKMKANLSWNMRTSSQKQRPIATDVITATVVANFAPLPFPAPSSFATLTLRSCSFTSYNLSECLNVSMDEENELLYI